MDYLIRLKRRELSLICHQTGHICMLLGLLMLIPIIVAILYNETRFVFPFLYSSGISILIGFFLYRIFKGEVEFSLKSAMVFSAIIWLVVCALGALPYYFSGQLNYLDAYFEAMSGFTTTGFSMFPNLDNVPYTIHFWRGFTQWIGGIGIIVLALSFLSSSGSTIMRLYIAEGRDERILPSIKHTVKIILYIYLIYTGISIILFLMAGMPLFDSIFYSFTALSTGGFAIYNDSIGHYHSLWIEIAAMIVMFLGATNFALHYTILRGRWREYFKDIETKVAYSFLIFGTVVVAIFLHPSYGSASLRYSIFQVVSALTTTGFQTVSGAQILTQWMGLGIFMLTILMIAGAGSCSTGGGMKWLRLGLMAKGIYWEIRSFLLPERARVPTMIHHVTDMVVDDKLLKLIGLFVFNYLLIYVVSVIVLLFYYPNNGGVLFEVASALSNVGLTSGLMTSTSPTVTKLVFILDFWVGRLEIWPVLLSVTIAMNMLRRTLKRRSKT